MYRYKYIFNIYSYKNVMYKCIYKLFWTNRKFESFAFKGSFLPGMLVK